MKKIDDTIKSGKDILDDFFKNIENIENIDKSVAKSLRDLYQAGKFTDANVKNSLQQLREKDGN
jgi:hypothetical protein